MAIVSFKYKQNYLLLFAVFILFTLIFKQDPCKITYTYITTIQLIFDIQYRSKVSAHFPFIDILYKE